MIKLFYKPDKFWAADAIPFYDNGEFHIFYLLDYRDPINHGEGTPWFKVTTKDFIHYKDHGEMLKRGNDKEYDMYVFTGSVIKHDGLYHIFYTGHNTKMDPGNYLQAIMHAVSKDLENWTKIKEDTFVALNDEYEIRDWRDPFVYFDEKDNCFYMLLSTRKKSNLLQRRGTTALLKSNDLKKWELLDPIYEPGLYYAHECPDLFKIGDWYYHVFSEFSHYNITRYVMAKDIKGPWIKPFDDRFDGRAFYAAKTVSDGKNRYIIGWNPTKENNVDSGNWQWGGVLEVHQILQREDGTLKVKMVDNLDSVFTLESVPNFHRYNQKEIVDVSKISSIGKVETLVCNKKCDDIYEYHLDFIFDHNTSRIGALLNVCEESDNSYGFFIEPKANRVVFEKFPNFPQNSMNAITCERPLILKAGELNKVRIIVQDDIAVCYVNDEVALSTRMYDFNTRKVGLLVDDGVVSFTKILIKEEEE